jgi:hypothetical protein
LPFTLVVVWFSDIKETLAKGIDFKEEASLTIPEIVT